MLTLALCQYTFYEASLLMTRSLWSIAQLFLEPKPETCQLSICRLNSFIHERYQWWQHFSAFFLLQSASHLTRLVLYHKLAISEDNLIAEEITC